MEYNDVVRLPMLSRDNFVTQFRDSFRDWALSQGPAGNIIRTGVDVSYKGDNDIRPVTFDIMDPPHQIVNGVAVDANGAPVNLVRRFANNQNGIAIFHHEEGRYEKFNLSKMRIISKLLSMMEKEVRIQAESQAGFNEAITTNNLLQVWNLTSAVCLGRGAVSIYNVTTKLWNLKQEKPQDWASFSKEWRETVAELNGFGQPQDILMAMLNTKFILSCHQEYFKEILTQIYGTNEWPNHQDLTTRLNTYYINTEKMKGVILNEGAYASNLKVNDLACFNCGGNHFRANCQRAPSKCNKCGKMGHLARYCDVIQEIIKKKKEEENLISKKRSDESEEKVYNKAKKGDIPAKSAREPKAKIGTAKFIKRKVKGKYRQYLTENNEGEYDKEDQDEEEQDYDEENDIDEEDNEFSGVTTVHELDINDTPEVVNIHLSKEKELLVNKPEEIIFLLDTGCKRLHITKHRELLSDLRPTRAKISGITGNSTQATYKGQLPLVGEALLVETADANLISVRQIALTFQGSFYGDSNSLTIKDKDGKIILVGLAKRNHDRNADYNGYYTCTAADLINAASKSHRPTHHVYPIVPSNDLPIAPRHYTAEQRSRALDAWKLCALLGHPGHEKIATDLDNGAHPESNLTSQDVKNGLELFGDCTACLEGKMNNPPENSSKTPPAQYVGEHLHIDLLELTRGPSVGGYTQLLVAVDEKSGYISIIPCVNKSAPNLCEALQQLIAFYNQHRHTVSKITSDHERTLLATKQFLSGLGVEQTATPAGLHEKRIERYIQTLKKRKASILSQLAYKLPSLLDAEAFSAAANSMNMSSCSVSKPYTPYHLVTGLKPLIPTYYFGQVGLFKGVSKDMNAEWGIFVSHGDSINSLRAYFPLRRGIHSRRKFIPHSSIPKEWNYPARISKIGKEMNTIQDINQPANTTPIKVNPPTADDFISNSSIQQSTSQKQVIFAPTPSQPALLPPPPPPLPAFPPPSSMIEPLLTDPLPVPSASKGAFQRSWTEVVSSQPSSNPQPPSPNPTAPPVETVQPPSSQSQPLPHSKHTSQSLPQTESSSRPKRTATQNKGWIHGRPQPNIRNFSTDILLDNVIHQVYRVSFGAALKMSDNQQQIQEALFEEIDNMMRNKVVKPIHPTHYTSSIKKRTVPAHMFFKMKYKADGSFDKVKARLVANGDQQHPDTIGDTFSPTVNPITVKSQLQATVANSMFLSAYDIKGAFLLSKVDKDSIIFIRVPQNVCTYWVKRYPQLKSFQCDDGSLLFQLKKYIYGLAESPNKFNSYLDKTLKLIGFKQLQADKCLYSYKSANGNVILSVHVDDMLVSSSSLPLRKWFEDKMAQYFELVSQRDTNISYLGMNIIYDRNKKLIQLSQDGMIKDLLVKYHCEKINKPPNKPCIPSIFNDPSEIEGNKNIDRKEFLSMVMSLMYLARFTRHDILLPVTVLATRSQSPRESDMSHLIRIVRYLSGSRYVAPIFDGNVPIKPEIYADASHCIHPSGHGHGGIIITLGSAPIHCQSYKLKLATRSSAESELVVLEEAVTYVSWLKLLLNELGFPLPQPITVYQDNQSTIIIGTEGSGNFKRTKHMISRRSFVSEAISENLIALQYKPTKEMIADFLTKALPAPQLEQHLDSLRLIM